MCIVLLCASSINGKCAHLHTTLFVLPRFEKTWSITGSSNENLNWGLWVIQSKKDAVSGNRSHGWIVTILTCWVHVHKGLLLWREVALCSVCTAVGRWSVWSCCWREELTQTTKTSLAVLLCTSLRGTGTGFMLHLIRAWLALDFPTIVVVVTEKNTRNTSRTFDFSGCLGFSLVASSFSAKGLPHSCAHNQLIYLGKSAGEVNKFW